jgi:uncharacterized membrane protein HdeD (DUF308 family)
MVIMIASTVCFGVIASGAIVAMVVLFRPQVDVSVWISRVTGILNTMVGLLAGYLAGRTDTKVVSEQQSVTDIPYKDG